MIDVDLLSKCSNDKQSLYRLWEPQNTVIVLGRSNDEEREVFCDLAEKDGIPVIKRMGGGGAVILSKGMLVISLVKSVKRNYYNQYYFMLINELIISALRNLSVGQLRQNGISDICILDRKILGSSIYRKRKTMFYQAVMLIDTDIAMIDRYLRYPSRAPSYREGRGHKEFVTTLANEGYSISIEQIKHSLSKELDDKLRTIN